MLDPSDPLSVVSWQVREDGLHVWRDAELIAVIEHNLFPHMIEDLARGLLRERHCIYH